MRLRGKDIALKWFPSSFTRLALRDWGTTADWSAPAGSSSMHQRASHVFSASIPPTKTHNSHNSQHSLFFFQCFFYNQKSYKGGAKTTRVCPTVSKRSGCAQWSESVEGRTGLPSLLRRNSGPGPLLVKQPPKNRGFHAVLISTEKLGEWHFAHWNFDTNPSTWWIWERSFLLLDVWCPQYWISLMYGIFTYIHHKNQPNVGKYAIHGSLVRCIIKLVTLTHIKWCRHSKLRHVNFWPRLSATSSYPMDGSMHIIYGIFTPHEWLLSMVNK